MAINPFPRIQPLEIPTALPSGARAPEGTFNNIASIGDAIGEYRTRNQVERGRARRDRSGDRPARHQQVCHGCCARRHRSDEGD